MNHPIDYDPETPPRQDSKYLRLLETLIDKIIERLDDDSCQPKIRDALIAIQLREKVAKTSEAENTFWEMIDSVRTSESSRLYPEPTNLEAQIQRTILQLSHEVKSGILPVKTITDTFNQARSEQGRLTYHRMGRLLSTMGFTKAKTPNGCSAIIWNDEFLLCPPDKGFTLKVHPEGERGGSMFAPARSPNLDEGHNSIKQEE